MNYRFFFNFYMEIRKMIYTTNIIESLNSQFRKIFEIKKAILARSTLV